MDGSLRSMILDNTIEEDDDDDRTYSEDSQYMVGDSVEEYSSGMGENDDGESADLSDEYEEEIEIEIDDDNDEEEEDDDEETSEAIQTGGRLGIQTRSGRTVFPLSAVEEIILQSNPNLYNQIINLVRGNRNDDDNDDDYGAQAARERVETIRQRRVYQQQQRLRRSQLRKEFEDEIGPIPNPRGIKLQRSGEFGYVPEKPPACRIKGPFGRNPSLNDKIVRRSLLNNPRQRLEMAKNFVPTQDTAKVPAIYSRHAYSGQFSQDGSFFYTCVQDFRVRLYSTLNPGIKSSVADMDERMTTDTRMKLYKTIRADVGRWTITDATLSPDNRFIAYSSICPIVHLSPTHAGNQDDDSSNVQEEQTTLDFSAGNGGRVGIWSIRFSSDGREIVAGASGDSLYVYNLETNRLVLRLRGHQGDVNAVCFADQSPHVLYSGSDDSFVKVWDRRSMRSGKPSGVLAGHTEGITHVASKNDGRYALSNSKDQTMKLWDVRMMISGDDEDRLYMSDYSTGFDYRYMDYPGNKVHRHPDDCSVMTYHGHRVLKTLIRCHFSPALTTGQSYLYSGSEDGRVHIYNLDGSIKRILDVGKSIRERHGNFDERNQQSWTRRSWIDEDDDEPGSFGCACVRDVSWHPQEPWIASTAWTTYSGESGVVMTHEWSDE